MGDISIMARRLADGHVQYGWSGNGGYFSMVGARLLLWYQQPKDVEYLFGLGQTQRIGQIGSEKGGFSFFESHDLVGEPFWLGTTEKAIFSKIHFVDYGYFYDLNHQWYYIIPGVFKIKVPLKLIGENLSENGTEFFYRVEIEDKVIKYILTEYVQKDDGFRKYLEREGYCLKKVIEDIQEDGRFSEVELYRKYPSICEYFDNWVVVKANDTDTAITDIIVKKKEDIHVETCEW